MKKIIVLFAVALTLLNCKNKEQKTENSNFYLQEVAEETTTPLDLGCYVFDDGKNNIFWKLPKTLKKLKVN